MKRFLAIVPFLFLPTFAFAANGDAKQHIAREAIEWADIWIPDANSTALPHVLLIGDSITRGYYPQVAEKLKGRVSVAFGASAPALAESLLPAGAPSAAAGFGTVTWFAMVTW